MTVNELILKLQNIVLHEGSQYGSAPVIVPLLKHNLILEEVFPIGKEIYCSVIKTEARQGLTIYFKSTEQDIIDKSQECAIGGTRDDGRDKE